VNMVRFLFRKSKTNSLTHSLADLLTKAKTIASFDKPRTKDYAEVKYYFQKKAPLCDEEQKFIYCKEDIITLKPDRDSTWLDTVVEKIPQKFPCWLTRVRNLELYRLVDIANIP